MSEVRSKLSADPASMILGIVSLVVVVLGCCCGLVAVVTLAMSIVGLVMANKSLREYAENPDAFSESSRKNVAAAKIICIISTVLSALLVLIAAVWLAIYGKSFSEQFEKGMMHNGHFEWNSDQRRNDDFSIKDSTPVVTDTAAIPADTIKIK
jgi:hypothetical protein